MRDPDRIKDFMDELEKIWHDSFPDWRFGQLMSNILGFASMESKKDIFFIEDDEMLGLFKKYFSSA